MRVSVIIPAYNSETMLDRCLKALSNSTCREFEVILVDDNSQDATKEIVKNFPFVRYFRNQTNLGPAISRNLGAKHAKGKYLFFIDADCVPETDWIERMLIRFTKSTDVVAVSGGYSNPVDREDILQLFQHLDIKFRHRKIKESIESTTSGNLGVIKEVFDRIEGFPEIINEDEALGYLLSREGRVLWDQSNGVRHHFKGSHQKYLMQQYSFAKSVFLLQSRNTQMIKAEKTYSPLKIIFELFVTLLILLAPLYIIIQQPMLVFISILIYVLLHIGYLKYMYHESKSIAFSCYALPLSFFRNIYWMGGLISGLYSFLKGKTPTKYDYHKINR
tara:strand:+ start:248 stop:1243 length:996 start_codon:yes stop_codon:yes gene_type:complete